jgi:cell division protein FtsQ
LNGKLHVYVKQREPLFRVINQHGESYYVEKSGMKIPFLQNYPIRVPVLSGMIEETMSDSSYVKSRLLQEAMLLFAEIRSDVFLDAQIEQVYVDKFKDLLLIPKVGNHTIVMGNTERLSDKLHALKLFYHEALNKLGWDIYREIDLRYKGQIVARK